MMKDSSHLVISATSRVFFSYKCDTSKESYPFSYIKRTTFFLPRSGPDLRVDAHFFSTTIIKKRPIETRQRTRAPTKLLVLNRETPI